MKKIMLCILSLLVVATGFAENLVVDNQSSYPSKQSKIVIQWASSAKEVNEGNNAIMYKSRLNADTFKAITKAGKITVAIPEKAEYFRVLAWSKGEGDPDFLTNWVDIVPGKTYTLKQDHLVPSVLMLGTGC